MRREANARKHAEQEVKRSNRGRNIGIVFGVGSLAALVIFGGFGAALNSLFFPSDATPPAGTLGFVINDPLANVNHTLSKFSGSLYGLPIGDAAGPTAWKLIKSGDVSDFTATDFNTAIYSRFYMKYNGSVAQTDDVFDDSFGTRTYPVREQEVYSNKLNKLSTYAAPSTVVLELKNMTNLAAITNATATPIVAQNNLTIIIAATATYPHSAYVSYLSLSANSWVYPQIVFTYNTTATTANAMQLADTVMASVSATQMAYRFPMLTGVMSFAGLWPSDATTGSIGITNAAVQAPSGTSLATNP